MACQPPKSLNLETSFGQEMTDLYGAKMVRLWLNILNPHKGLPLIFYLLHMIGPFLTNKMNAYIAMA